MAKIDRLKERVSYVDYYGDIHFDVSNIKGKVNDLYYKGYRPTQISSKVNYDIRSVEQMIDLETQRKLLFKLYELAWYIEAEEEEQDIKVFMGIDDRTYRNYKKLVEQKKKEDFENNRVIIEFYKSGYSKSIITDILGESVHKVINQRVIAEREALRNILKCEIINGLSVEVIAKKTGKDNATIERLLAIRNK